MAHAHLIGLLKVRVIKGVNLVVKDAISSDPYVIVTMGSQKLKTRVIDSNCNPVWNDQLTFAVYDLDTPIKLEVYDKDLFSADDEMGDANIDIKPYVRCLRASSDFLQTGTVFEKVYPNRENSLADVSSIVCKDGTLVQLMELRLNNVATGEVEIELEWAHAPGSRGLGL